MTELRKKLEEIAKFDKDLYPADWEQSDAYGAEKENARLAPLLKLLFDIVDAVPDSLESYEDSYDPDDGFSANWYTNLRLALTALTEYVEKEK